MNTTRTLAEEKYAIYYAAGRALANAMVTRATNMRALNRHWTEAVDELRRVQRIALDEFATLRGWRVSKKPFSIDKLQPELRGANWYPFLYHQQSLVDANNVPTAILSHTYKKWPDIEQFASAHGLAVERLPYSWYYPGGTLACLFTAPVRQS